ncbi:MAG: hypothetical protein ACTSYE_00920 [Alphaproteobacteria bacterium]
MSLGILPVLAIFCAAIKPMAISAMHGRTLTEQEVWATTLMCFTGPFGYFIAIENGWIGPDFLFPPQ